MVVMSARSATIDPVLLRVHWRRGPGWWVDSAPNTDTQEESSTPAPCDSLIAWEKWRNYSQTDSFPHRSGNVSTTNQQKVSWYCPWSGNRGIRLLLRICYWCFVWWWFYSTDCEGRTLQELRWGRPASCSSGSCRLGPNPTQLTHTHARSHGVFGADWYRLT